METKISVSDFLKTLKQKARDISYTEHSIQRAKTRKIISEAESIIKRFEKDIKDSNPDVVVEQTSENPDERKFKAYYKAIEGGFMTYIIILDGYIRLLTIYRTSKTKQEQVYKHAKRVIHHERG